MIPKGKKGKFIAVANMKGGVGKTTTVVSLAETLAADDPLASVLVIDLDPQASASLCLAGDAVLASLFKGKRTIQDFLRLRIDSPQDSKSIARFIRRYFSYTTHNGKMLNIALLPSGPNLRLFERELIYKFSKQGDDLNALEQRLWTLFERDFAPLAKEYNFIIFDCPPGISPFSEVAIRQSDIVVVPTIPDEISNFGLIAFCREIWRSTFSSLPSPSKPYVLPTRVQINVNQHKFMLDRFVVEAQQDDSDFHLLSTRIPQAAQLAQALVAGVPQTYARKYGTAAIQHLSSLVTEIKEIVHGTRN